MVDSNRVRHKRLQPGNLLVLPFFHKFPYTIQKLKRLPLKCPRPAKSGRLWQNSRTSKSLHLQCKKSEKYIVEKSESCASKSHEVTMDKKSSHVREVQAWTIKTNYIIKLLFLIIKSKRVGFLVEKNRQIEGTSKLECKQIFKNFNTVKIPFKTCWKTRYVMVRKRKKLKIKSRK